MEVGGSDGRKGEGSGRWGIYKGRKPTWRSDAGPKSECWDLWSVRQWRKCQGESHTGQSHTVAHLKMIGQGTNIKMLCRSLDAGWRKTTRLKQNRWALRLWESVLASVTWLHDKIKFEVGQSDIGRLTLSLFGLFPRFSLGKLNKHTNTYGMFLDKRGHSPKLYLQYDNTQREKE